MKTGYIFWGTLLIVLGLILLFNSFGGIFPDFGVIFKFWPLLIVLWGISMLKLNPLLKKILSGLSGLFLALLLGALILNNWCWFKCDTRYNSHDYKYSYTKVGDKYLVHSSAYSDSVKTVTLNIEGGAAFYQFGDTCSNMIDVYSDKNNYDFRFESDTDEQSYSFRIDGSHFMNFFHRDKESIATYIKLNPKVSWNLNFDIGASEIKADLSKYRIANLDFDAGAASIEVKIGDLNDTTNINIDAGATSVKLLIPSTSGCELEYDTGLSNVTFQGFQNNNGVYYTENFSSASKKIKINISGGVSSFKIVRI